MLPTKLLTFESWVTRKEWYDYAVKNEKHVPYLLVDRSPCQDPFFDHFAPPLAQQRPLITGLCRKMKNFQVGQRFIYITKIDRLLFDTLGIKTKGFGTYYFGVISLTVKRVWNTHSEAAKDFVSRRYAVAPLLTPYPPNLAHNEEPVAAIPRESTISYDQNRRPHIPPDTTYEIWRAQYAGYYNRQKDSRLRAAECQIESVGSNKAFQLNPELAPIFTSADWGNKSLNVQGLLIEESIASQLVTRIASSNKDLS